MPVLRHLSVLRGLSLTLLNYSRPVKPVVCIRVKREDRFGEAAENNTRVACAPQILVIREARRLPSIRFNDLTGAKQFVFIRVYSWLTFADGCG